MALIKNVPLAIVEEASQRIEKATMAVFRQSRVKGYLENNRTRYYSLTLRARQEIILRVSREKGISSEELNHALISLYGE